MFLQLLSQASQFDTHHSFIVRYTAAEDLGLDMHTDDSEPWIHFNLSNQLEVCMKRLMPQAAFDMGQASQLRISLSMFA